MPFLNRQNNDDLILAIQAAGVSRGRNGFRKDKAGEKLAESEESLLEHRTDGTDAFDTLYIGAEKFPQNHTISVNSSSISQTLTHQCGLFAPPRDYICAIIKHLTEFRQLKLAFCQKN